MRILRIEHSSVLNDGVPAGPYIAEPFVKAEHWDEGDDFLAWYCERDDCIHQWMDAMSWKTSGRTPTPGNDGMAHEDIFNKHFGFRSVEQMRNWFRGYMKQLTEFGFVAAVYEVPKKKTKHGFSQSVFVYANAKRIGDATIQDYKAIERMMQS